MEAAVVADGGGEVGGGIVFDGEATWPTLRVWPSDLARTWPEMLWSLCEGTVMSTPESSSPAVSLMALASARVKVSPV